MRWKLEDSERISLFIYFLSNTMPSNVQVLYIAPFLCLKVKVSNCPVTFCGSLGLGGGGQTTEGMLFLL